MSTVLPHNPAPSSKPFPSPLLPHHNSSQSQSQASTQTPQQASQHQGLRVPSNRKTIYDRNINRTRTAELSRASFAYIFSEMITYAQRRVTGIQDLERKLNEQGYPLGLRLTPLLLHRQPPPSSSQPQASRPTRILPLLTFLSQVLWRHLFARPADAIESSATDAREYMISDNEPLVNEYISVPKEMSQLNCAAFVAGIVEGVVCGVLGGQAGGKGEPPAVVSAHNAGEEGGMWPGKTVFLIRFSEDVVKREAVK